MAERIAVLADIHGNLPALEAVMADLHHITPDRVYIAGDLVNRCPWSNEVLEIVRSEQWLSIQGNHDLIVGVLDMENPATPFGNRARFPELWWTMTHMSRVDRAFLAALPAETVIEVPGLPAIRMVHGVPGDPFVGFEPGATATNLAATRDVAEAILIAGHTHIPMHETLPGLEILNPGGVGISHNGDPRAHYMLLHGGDGVWQPEFRVVGYAQDRVSAAFYESGFMEFAGPMGELHLRTVLSGHAWASDFNFWMKSQPSAYHENIPEAVRTYLRAFPDETKWAFPVGIA